MLLLLCAGCGVRSVQGTKLAPTLGNTLRAAEQAAAASNPITQPALIAPSSWTANTYYSQGQVVLNGSNQYMVYNNPGGTSGSGTGPSGTGAAPIADAGITWYYYGKPLSTTTSSSAPVITNATAAPSALSQFYGTTAEASNFAFTGGKVGPISGSEAVQIVPSPEGSMSFVTDAPQLTIEAVGQHAAQIIVDGRNVIVGGNPELVINGNAYLTLDFTSAGGRKSRTITWLNWGGLRFSGVAVDPASTVSAPLPAFKIRACLFGDSIAVGGNGFPLIAEDFWSQRVGEMLGWSDVWNLAQGGTGYVNPGPSGSSTFVELASEATSNGCNLVLFWGGLNDAYYADSQIQSAALKTFQSIRAGLPNAPIVVFGLYPASSGPSATVIGVENAIHAAVTQFDDPLTYFVPVSTDPAGPWVYGTGTVVNPAGNGNADICVSNDGAHPTETCITDILAPHIANALQTVIQKIP
jgi:hypothetical protein